MRFAVVSDPTPTNAREDAGVSIRFEVRGGFRPVERPTESSGSVSIRFEVRGGFRQQAFILEANPAVFQSALRFAVVSDGDDKWYMAFDTFFVSIRFEVRGGFRRGPYQTEMVCNGVSIRFEVRGGFRLLPARCANADRKSVV